MWTFSQEHHAPVKCGILGGFLIGVIGVLLPPTMFWGEFEINTLANPARPLPHIWPQSGIWGTGPFEDGAYSPAMYALIGFVKLLAISITVLSGMCAPHILQPYGSTLRWGVPAKPL
jgi:H+/Cl- antiporter ClcA